MVLTYQLLQLAELLRRELPRTEFTQRVLQRYDALGVHTSQALRLSPDHFLGCTDLHACLPHRVAATVRSAVAYVNP